MGRHSVPDDTADDTVVSAAATATLPTVFTELDRSAGSTHSGPVPPPADGSAGSDGSSGSDGSAESLVDAAVSPTRADVNLLKAVPGLRAQALAGLVVPYLLYTVVMVLLARTDVFLLWLWIPTVFAGALVGHLLDRAHAAKASPSSGQSRAEPAEQGSVVSAER